MNTRTPRLLLALLCAGTAALSLAAPASALVVGVSDNNSFMFADPRFLAVHFGVARREVAWDAATRPQNADSLAAVKIWVQAARSAHVTPLISIGADDGQSDSSYIPSLAQYKRSVQALMRALPSVHTYAAWNEPDWIYRHLSKTPLLAASYYNTVVSLCHCTVLAGDLYLQAPDLGRWLQAYVKGIHGRPAGWALHDYTEIRGRNTSQIDTLMRYTSGPIWLDETGGVLSRGHWKYRNQSANAAAVDEKFLFGLVRRYPRITHILHYQWESVFPYHWDSGLVDYHTGLLRPAYATVYAATHHGSTAGMPRNPPAKKHAKGSRGSGGASPKRS